MPKPPAPSVIASPEPVIASPAPTPENTPVPGAGSWHWHEALGDWVPNPPDSITPITPTPTLE